MDPAMRWWGTTAARCRLPARQTVTDTMRAVNRSLIRDQIVAIAAEYRFSPAW